MTTPSLKASEITKQWYLVDAANLVTGRLAAELSRILRGKHKPSYTPHMDCGDNIVVVNAEKIAFTGKKWRDKIYYRHTGYPGGIKSQSAEHIRRQYPERILRLAVQRMLPRGPLGRQQMSNLRIYVGNEHPHAGQNPKKLDIAAQNKKNSYGSEKVS